MLIGICGKMGSGKDYIASNIIIPYIEKMYNKKCFRFSFADQIKINVMVKNNIQHRDVYVEKNEKTRSMLQKEGTEHGREVHGKDVWINYYKSWTRVFLDRGVDVIVTSDVRFKNEVDFIKSNNGIVVKVEAPKRNEKRLRMESNDNMQIYEMIRTHQSECDLDDCDESKFDVVVQNDYDDAESVSNLYKVLDNVFTLEASCE